MSNLIMQKNFTFISSFFPLHMKICALDTETERDQLVKTNYRLSKRMRTTVRDRH